MNALLVALAAAATLHDPQADEARARALEEEIRCVVCQNAPISESASDLAADMRALIRERIAAGDSDAEIRAFFRERYGEFVLLRPSLDPGNWLLWAAPILLILGGAAAAAGLRRRGEAPATPEAGDDDR
jgi:cytochrome c-type biogenesis protein CcmH